jgi:hypothetical protein
MRIALLQEGSNMYVKALNSCKSFSLTDLLFIQRDRLIRDTEGEVFRVLSDSEILRVDRLNVRQEIYSRLPVLISHYR